MLGYKFGKYPKDTVWDIARWLDLHIPTFYEVEFKISKEGTITVYELTEEQSDEVNEFELGLQHLRISDG